MERFVFDSFLGAGGSAQVWRVFDNRTQDFVALKIGNSKWISHEYRVHRRLNHQHIVPLIDQAEIDALQFTYNQQQYGAFAMPVETTDLEATMRVGQIFEICIISNAFFIVFFLLHRIIMFRNAWR